MRNLARRLAKLEARSGPAKPLRLVVRYEGCDLPDSDWPEEDIDESDPNTVLLSVQYIDMPRGWKTDEDDR